VLSTSSEKVIRRLYEITNHYDQGFDAQVKELLSMGLERFNLDIGILSKIENGMYMVEQCVVPEGVELASGVKFEFDITYCHITCEANAPVAIENIGQHDIYASHPAYQSFGLESYIGMPIKIDGELYGTLNFSSPDPYERSFKDVDIDVLQLMASWIEVELVRRRQEKDLLQLNEELVRKAYQDSLTELPNRRAMFKHLNKELNRVYRSNGCATLVVIDIDFFKSINDKYGHQKGDDVLVDVSHAIAKTKRNYDYIARFGGEEFLLWLPDVTHKIATEVCERIRKNIAKLTLTDETITMSFGMTCYQYQETDKFNIKEKIDQLISEADKALYRAKTNGRDRIEFYK
jgi:diguanylate cyclase (GGDEF)-like protein